jgi:Lar family restriction alleviation protein
MPDDPTTGPRPCPFCGGTDVSIWQTWKGTWIVSCRDCGAQAPFRDTREAAVAAWDRRAGGEIEVEAGG